MDTISRQTRIIRIFASVLFINLLLITLIGFLTLDSFATDMTRFAAVMLSLTGGYAIVKRTPELDGATRLLRYGAGLSLYALIAFLLDMPEGFSYVIRSGMLFCVLALALVLLFGKGR